MTIDAADDLYGLPLADFVAARNQLAKQLAQDGDAEETRRVKALRKPTVAAWELNQVARQQPELITALRETHRQLRSATSADGLRSASAGRMEAIRSILAAAGDVTAAVTGKMRSTLLAVATDPVAEEALTAGRLDADLEPAGLGGFEAASPFTSSAASSGPAPAVSTSDRDVAKEAKARRHAERLEKEADEAAAEAARLRADADRANRLATAAEARAVAARERAEEAGRA